MSHMESAMFNVTINRHVIEMHDECYN